jgi:excisionase family DNA binding protein
MPNWASWSVDEASRITGYSEEQLRRLIRDRKIEAVKFGPVYAIRQESLLRYIEEAKQSGDARSGPKGRGAK